MSPTAAPHGKVNHLRLGIVTFEPLRCLLICLQSLLHVAELRLVQLRKILLLGRSTAQVSAQNVVVDRARQDTGSIFRVGLAIHLESFLKSVGCVVGFVEILGLNSGGFFKSLTGFLVYFEAKRSFSI